MTTFSSQIAKFADKYEKRLRATARYAVQDVVEDAQTPVRGGGRMRIVTGFLRASIQAAIGYMPSGPVVNDMDKNYPEGTQVAGEPVSATLLRWNPAMAEHLFIGWTANYARFREYEDGFLRGAVEQWDEMVRLAVKRVQLEIP